MRRLLVGGIAAIVAARLDGTLHRVPCTVNCYDGARCPAPGGRHVVRGRCRVCGNGDAALATCPRSE